MTAGVAEERQPVGERLAVLADELRALADEFRAGQESAEAREAEPEQRRTAGADALRWMDEHHPAAPAAGRDTEHEEQG